MHLTQFKQLTDHDVQLVWDDGHAGPVLLRRLRDACPCAGCRGETVLFASYTPPPADITTPGRYQLTEASAVGNYAMKFRWGDGHGEGIYTWGSLRALCECEVCTAVGTQAGSAQNAR